MITSPGSVTLDENKLRGYHSASELHRPVTAAAGESSPTFAVRGCCVVSAADPYGRQSRVSRPLGLQSGTLTTRQQRPLLLQA
jgi:hypothetical protein